jgi:hypothetical protein
MAAGAQESGSRAWRLVTSRRRQRELLRCWSTWTLTQILLAPERVADARDSGWAGKHHHDVEQDLRIVGQHEGLGFGVNEGWHTPTELIAWSAIEEIAKSIPAQARADLAAFKERWSEHQCAYPRFVARRLEG